MVSEPVSDYLLLLSIGTRPISSMQTLPT